MVEVEEIIKKYGIGLTGGIATGKSTVGRMIEGQGYTVIDADDLARRVVEPKSAALARVVDAFGGKVLNQNGTLNRAALREMVFQNDEKRKLLESIVHPVIQQKLAQELKDRGLFAQPSFWFYDATLIYETQQQQKFRRVWVVHCDPETQIKRLVARDKIDTIMAQKIINSQMPIAKKVELADLAIDSNTSMNDLEGRVLEALDRLRRVEELSKAEFPGSNS